MGIRNKINTRRVHYKKLGAGGLKFLKERRQKAQDEIISFKVRDYKNTFNLRNKTSDLPTFYQCIFNREYDIPINFEPSIILDLGANIGLTTAFFKQKYPNTTIIAVEPEASNFELLKANTNGLDSIKLYNTGIWNKKSELIVENNGSGHYGYTVKEVENGTPGSLKAISINDIIAENNIDCFDVVKIDIEGSEKNLFESNTDWLSKTKVLIIELHDRLMPGSAKSVFNALSTYDYEFSFKGENIIIYLEN